MSLRPLLCAALITTASVLFLAPSSAHAATPGSIQVTGNQLKSALPRASYFGSGYTITGRFGTGNYVQHDPATVNLARMSCASAQYMFTQPGYGETALAFEGASSVQGQPYTPTIYQFANAHTASVLFSEAHAKSASCHSYTLPPVQGSSQHVSQHDSTTRIGGHLAFLITQSNTFSGLAGSLKTYVLITIDGSDLFIVRTDATITNTLPDDPAPSAVTLYMISKVAVLR